jgi:hypothetical protein
MTLSIGTKVQISDNYLAAKENPDKTVTEVRGQTGKVTGYLGSFIEVTPDNTDNPFWNEPFLFYITEVTILEEAHPLQKEFAKS